MTDNSLSSEDGVLKKMGAKMCAVGNRARLPDGSEIEILAASEDEQQYRVRILTGPAVSLVRRGRLIRGRIITVPAENIEPLFPAPPRAGPLAAAAGRRC